MNIDGLDFNIIDYVKIRLDLAIDPKDLHQYGQNCEFMYSRAQTWGDLNRSAADFLERLQNLYSPRPTKKNIYITARIIN
jgi:hypothetical protein